MAISHAVKKNLSSIQVLKTLLVLLENNYTMQELVEKLNENENDSVFNNSVVSKYINTCRYCGIEIPKIQNKYCIAKMPFGLNLSMNDVALITKMQNVCKETFSNKINNGFNAFVEKLNKYTNKTLVKINKETLYMSYEAFEKAISDEKKVRILLRSKETLDCIPLSITTHQKRTFFNVKFENKEKSIPVDKISGIEILEEYFKVPNFERNLAIFKVYGDLSQRYNLREHEQLIEKDLNSSTVENKGEDKDILLSRLLRYDSLCEIKAPMSYREEMKKIIEETLANYGE
ncbi:MAG: WYL domain-containing protein [Cyanobacteria bacterium SIG31]|nr:WYL domain-containing protein [Cyanobacteria bacterium SIG31]